MRAVAAVLLLVAAVHAGIWGVLRERQQAPDFNGMLPSVSYTPFEPGHVVDSTVDPDRIRADLRKLSTMTRAIRSYSSMEGNELVPPIAAEFGLKVMVGAWLTKDKERNRAEIDAAVDLARHNGNVIGVVVGNETIFRGEQIPIENLGPLPATGLEPEQAKRIIELEPEEVDRINREETQRIRDAEAQPEDKKA